MFKTILIDDEELAIERLRRLLKPHAEVIDIIATANDGNRAVEVIESLKPDLIFLDIEMSGRDGFAVLDALEHLPWIIFSTAYDEYALKAFETTAIDYLLKPVAPERLAASIRKLQTMATGSAEMKEDAYRRQVEQVVQALRASGAGKAEPWQRIQVRLGDRIRFIPVEQVCFFRASEKYVEMHTPDAMYLLNLTLNKLERHLPEQDFVRIHRSALINLHFLDEAVRQENGSWLVRMKDARRTRLAVSRSARSRLGLV